MNAWTNLATREADGIDVSLDFNADAFESRIRVQVIDRKKGQDFTLYPPEPFALDCFYHPFAYAQAAMNGKSRRTVTA